MPPHGPVPPSNWAFFPGYPLAMRALHVVGVPWHAGRLGHQRGSGIAALFVIAALMRTWYDERVAVRTSQALALFPGSAVFVYMYAEGLFLLLAALSLLAVTPTTLGAGRAGRLRCRPGPVAGCLPGGGPRRRRAGRAAAQPRREGVARAAARAVGARRLPAVRVARHRPPGRVLRRAALRLGPAHRLPVRAVADAHGPQAVQQLPGAGDVRRRRLRACWRWSSTPSPGAGCRGCWSATPSRWSCRCCCRHGSGLRPRLLLPAFPLLALPARGLGRRLFVALLLRLDALVLLWAAYWFAGSVPSVSRSL